MSHVRNFVFKAIDNIITGLMLTLSILEPTIVILPLFFSSNFFYCGIGLTFLKINFFT
jgi:hypothetical protein